MKLPALFCSLAVVASIPAPVSGQVAAPPSKLVNDWGLDPFYKKHLDVQGLPILGSAAVSDYAMKEAAYLIDQMIGHRPDLIQALLKNHIRFAVMATKEMTTDLPEERTLEPKEFWDARARGLGPTRERPAVSCGEENLLCLPGDPYWKENILIHEFSHAIHEQALLNVDPSFDTRLKEAFQQAKAAGLWKGTYAMQDYREYWGESVQIWFECNSTNDVEHSAIGTRDELKSYDPKISALLTEVFGDKPWRYSKPSSRLSQAHLAGFDIKTAGQFSWPKNIKTMEQFGAMLPWIAAKDLPPRSRKEAAEKPSTINFINRKGHAVSVDWLDVDGKPHHYAEIAANTNLEQKTFAGHVWRVSANGTPLGGTVASDSTGRLEIR